MCGFWNFKDDGSCDFVVDKQRMARAVRVPPQIKLAELKDVVVSEFVFRSDNSSIVLSFWPSQGKKVSPTNQNPPVILSSDSSLFYSSVASV